MRFGMGDRTGALDGRSPMPHVDFKKSQCPMSLNLSCPMSSLLDTSMLHVDFKKWSCRVTYFNFQVTRLYVASILRNGHVALPIFGVKGIERTGFQTNRNQTTLMLFARKCQNPMSLVRIFVSFLSSVVITIHHLF